MWGIDVPVQSSPAVADGKVFVGYFGNKIFSLDENTGELIWSYDTEDEVKSSPAVANGKVFVGSGGDIYCFGKLEGSKPPSLDKTPALALPSNIFIGGVSIFFAMLSIILLLIVFGIVKLIRKRRNI